MAFDQSVLSDLLEALRSGGDLDFMREAMQLVLQALIDLEASQVIGAERYERSDARTTHRNGSRARLLSTKAGDVELAIPKLRHGSFFPALLEPRRRIDRALWAVIMEAFVHGVSTRKVDDLAQSLHLRAGSVLHLLAAQSGPGGPDFTHARSVTLHIVGIAVTRDDVVTVNAVGAVPTLLSTPAFLRQFDPSVFAFDGAYVRLRPGASRASFEARDQGLASRFPETGTSLFLADEHQQASIVERAIRPQAAALAVFSLLLGLAGLFIVGQVATRQMLLSGSEHHTLRALGMSRRQLTALGLAQVGMAAASGALLAVIGAVLVSPLTPIGPARIAEPQPGLAINWAVLGGGALTVFVLILAVVAVPAWSLAARMEPAEAAVVDHPSRLVRRSPGCLCR